MSITHLSGLQLKRAAIAGAQRVIQMQEQLNNINVFPVADSDTGTNMALTMRSVAEEALLCKEGSVHGKSRAVADSALMGARGNSGAILAQFFQEVFLQAAANHRQALAIIVTGALSGTFQAAQRAAHAVNERIDVHVVDSKNICIGLGLILREAAEAIESGVNDIEELKRRVDWAIQNVRAYISFETMEYLVRGGRVSRFRGALARWLNLRPILTMNAAGKIEVVAKTFGGNHGRRKLMDIVKRNAAGKRKLRFLVAHANNPEGANYHAEWIRKYFEIPEVPVVSVSPAFGAHAGPGAVGIAFLGE
ncbi:DegV family EDD domain-containing protein [candidate division KSB1 bacterium]|nr:DegV family EDD domain-containing protein [candidate division KSB1 bacterium]